MHISTLLEQNRTNYYKMLVVVDNSRQEDKIIQTLCKQGWTPCDVGEVVVEMVRSIPEDKIKLRIGDAIKKWFNSLPDKMIFYNTSILYSPELGRLNPVGAFKYKAREKKSLFLEGQMCGERIQYSQVGRPDYSEMDVGVN